MVRTMTLAQYMQMWQRIKKWQAKKKTKRLPNYVTVPPFGKIYKKTFMDMYRRVQKWQATHNGKMPDIIGIEGPAERSISSTTPATAPTPATTPTTPPPSSAPQRVLPNHTVSIGDIGFFAEAPEVVEPFQRIIYDKIEIENGPPRFYATNTRNREMNFKVTLIKKQPDYPDREVWTLPYKYSDGKPNFEELLNDVKQCEGIHQFSSIYIGSFKALITIKLNDFKPGTAVASFNVQEIP